MIAILLAGILMAVTIGFGIWGIGHVKVIHWVLVHTVLWVIWCWWLGQVILLPYRAHRARRRKRLAIQQRRFSELMSREMRWSKGLDHETYMRIPVWYRTNRPGEEEMQQDQS